jgi:hypothetical protein
MSMPGVVEEPAAPAPVAEQPQPVVSLAQALKGSLPSGCVEDFVSLLDGEGFSMGKFVKDLPPAVAKVKVQMKSPFGKPKDDDKTSVGLSVGCIKSLPESPAEIQGLLKDIALKAGLDFVVEAVENVAEDEKKVDVEKKGVRFGVRAGYNVNNFSFGYKDLDEGVEMGHSFGIGLALNVPITSIMRFNMGLDFYYRNMSLGDTFVGDELVVLIPVFLQFGNSFYFATGIQLNIPVVAKIWVNHYQVERSVIDFGVALGLGYRFANIGFDFNYVYGLTGLIKDGSYYKTNGDRVETNGNRSDYYYDIHGNIGEHRDKSWLGQYCFGVSYFF